MGQSAFVQKKIGVLSGVNSEEQLKDYADHIIPSISNICDLILDKGKTTDSKPQSQKAGMKMFAGGFLSLSQGSFMHQPSRS